MLETVLYTIYFFTLCKEFVLPSKRFPVIQELLIGGFFNQGTLLNSFTKNNVYKI